MYSYFFWDTSYEINEDKSTQKSEAQKSQK